MALDYRTYSFEKLDAWQLARALKNDIYRATQGFPQSERYGLTSQIRRSMGSVTTNLAEGSGRASALDKAHFTNIAYSRAIETIEYFITAHDLSFIGVEEYKDFRSRLDQVIIKINGLYKYQLKEEESLKSRMKNDRGN